MGSNGSFFRVSVLCSSKGKGRPVGQGALWQVRESLDGLLRDRRIPAAVREELADEFAAVEAMQRRLEEGQLEVAVLGRVSVGKSSLLNALLGRPAFTTSPLHGETRRTQRARWSRVADGQVVLCDTPGIDEFEAADLLLFVVDGDLTRSEWAALDAALGGQRPVLLVLNKADRYTGAERATLLEHLASRLAGRLAPQDILAVSADPGPRTVVRVDADGRETEHQEPGVPDVTSLRDRLWDIVEREGESLVALNAGLFAGALSDRVAGRITEVRRETARRLIDTYALAKGVAIGANPVPAADLAGAAALDATLILHLSRVYGLPVTRREAWRVLGVILGQLGALAGSLWTVNLFASLLKLGTGGASTVLTASAQGAVGYAATWLLGRVAEDYFRRGRAWGEGGAKRAVDAMLRDLDRETLLARARTRIRQTLQAGGRSAGA